MTCKWSNASIVWLASWRTFTSTMHLFLWNSIVYLRNFSWGPRILYWCHLQRYEAKAYILLLAQYHRTCSLPCPGRDYSDLVSTGCTYAIPTRAFHLVYQNVILILCTVSGYRFTFISSHGNLTGPRCWTCSFRYCNLVSCKYIHHYPGLMHHVMNKAEEILPGTVREHWRIFVW